MQAKAKSDKRKILETRQTGKWTRPKLHFALLAPQHPLINIFKINKLDCIWFILMFYTDSIRKEYINPEIGRYISGLSTRKPALGNFLYLFQSYASCACVGTTNLQHDTRSYVYLRYVSDDDASVSKFSWSKSFKENLVKVFLDKFDCLHYQSYLRNLYKKSQKIYKNLVNMWHFTLNFNFIFTSAIFYILQFSDITCKTLFENTSEILLLIFCYIWINISYQRQMSIIYDLLFCFKHWKSRKYKTLSEYSILIGWCPSKSVKVSRKIGWSSIPSKSVQVLWWTLIKVFFDRLHYQSLRQKLWPSFLVQENFDAKVLENDKQYVEIASDVWLHKNIYTYSFISKVISCSDLFISLSDSIWKNKITFV